MKFLSTCRLLKAEQNTIESLYKSHCIIRHPLCQAALEHKGWARREPGMQFFHGVFSRAAQGVTLQYHCSLYLLLCSCNDYPIDLLLKMPGLVCSNVPWAKKGTSVTFSAFCFSSGFASASCGSCAVRHKCVQVSLYKYMLIAMCSCKIKGHDGGNNMLSWRRSFNFSRCATACSAAGMRADPARGLWASQYQTLDCPLVQPPEIATSVHKIHPPWQCFHNIILDFTRSSSWMWERCNHT